MAGPPGPIGAPGDPGPPVSTRPAGNTLYRYVECKPSSVDYIEFVAFVFLRDLLDQVVSLDLKDQEEKRSVCVSFPYLFAPQREIGNGDCMLVNVDLSPSFTCRDPKGRLVLEGSLVLQGCRSDIRLLYNNRDLLLLYNNRDLLLPT